MTTVPFLAPMARVLTAVAVGLGTGLSTVMVVAMLDHFDLFGSVAAQRSEQRRVLLDAKLDAMLDAISGNGPAMAGT